MTGFGSSKRLDFARAGAALGITDPKVIANTESFRSAIGSTVLAQAKALGANPTNTDRDYIEKVQAGQIELNEDTIRRMLDINERMARDSISRYNTTADKVLSDLEKNPNVDPTAMGIVRTLGRINEPEQYRPPESAVQGHPMPPENVQPSMPMPSEQMAPQAAPQMSDFERAMLEKQRREQMRMQQQQQQQPQMPMVP